RASSAMNQLPIAGGASRQLRLACFGPPPEHPFARVAHNAPPFAEGQVSTELKRPPTTKRLPGQPLCIRSAGLSGRFGDLQSCAADSLTRGRFCEDAFDVNLRQPLEPARKVPVP